LQPLNTEEQALIKSRHFELRVAVDPGGYSPPRYPTWVIPESLLRDLGQTGLFTEIGLVGRIRSPDLIAMVTGNYYGDKEGQSFSLHWAKQPERRVNVSVWHYVSLWGRRTRRLALERLALEVIRQMDALGPPPRSTETGSSNAVGPSARANRVHEFPRHGGRGAAGKRRCS
jgi:hypothetical protein